MPRVPTSLSTAVCTWVDTLALLQLHWGHRPQKNPPRRVFLCLQADIYWPACLPVPTICMAEAIRPDTSVILLGTIRVVLASCATLP